MNETQIQNHLENLSCSNSDTIKKEVAKEAISYSSNDYRSFFNDLSKYGCQSGMISVLIYYVDTHVFFQKHYTEIEELRLEYEDATGHHLQPSGDLMNWYSWYAFETVAYRLAIELGILKE